MTWVRRGETRYYYRNVRAVGRPVRRYAGTGQAGELAAAADGLRRLEREIEAREWRAEQGRQQEAGAPLLRLCGVTGTLIRAALLAAGFHQHDRGVWRRCREPRPTDWSGAAEDERGAGPATPEGRAGRPLGVAPAPRGAGR